MSSFEPGFLQAQPLTHGLLCSVGAIRQAHGREELFRQQAPEVLPVLLRTSVISSTEASNRIEGIVAPAKRICDLVAGRTEPRNRSEQEIAGYLDVLNTIHVSFRDIPLSPNTVLQLHRDLFQFTDSPGGRWKSTDNQIIERGADGIVRLRFQPVSAWETPLAMDTLHRRLAEQWEREEVDRLLLIPAYVLDFLCIHPFLDGNGRMARLLTLLLLYRAGFEVGRYISLEQVVEQTRETYYETLAASSAGWHGSEHSLLPWWEYFLGVLIKAYRDFEERVGETRLPRGQKQRIVREVIARLPQRFNYREVDDACPGVSRGTIRKAMVELRDEGEIRCVRSGPNAVWEKIAPS